ncbi:hypothetical protein [Singulisphaera sp. PoT]|uniref:hypothetical protein n=1 Tax=Singulisphaera sp. PoT TaxID=3411797 RepID=UPI003BF5C755
MRSTIIRRIGPTLAIASAFLLGTGFADAQDPGDKPKDEAIEKLLDNLDGSKDQPTPPPDKPEEKKADAEAKKPDAEPKKSDKKAEDAKTDGKKSEESKSDGDVSSKDKDIDSLLEKLGETTDQPSPDDKPKQGGGPGGEPAPNEPGQGEDKNQEKEKKDDLSGQSKQLDEHLEELTGRKKPKKNNGGGGGGGGGSGEASGPMGEVIKRMREVEQRLGKTDTGEETRKKQSDIVKNLEQLIEQSRQQSSSSSSKKKQLSMSKQGQQKPGSKENSDNPGTMAGNAPNQKPEKPTNRRSLAGGKDEWGHLPPELRQELDNVFKEEALERKSDLIRRYYLSLSKKRTNREE